MHLDREQVRAGEQVGDRHYERAAVSRGGHSGAGEVRVADGSRRQVLPIDFDAVQIVNRAVIHDGTERQLGATRLADKDKRGAEIPGDDPRAATIHQRQPGILGRRQHGGGIIEQCLPSRPGAVVVAWRAPDGAQVHAEAVVSPGIGDSDQDVRAITRRLCPQQRRVAHDFVDNHVLVKLEIVRRARSKRGRKQPAASAVRAAPARLGVNYHGVNHAGAASAVKKKAVTGSCAETQCGGGKLQQRTGGQRLGWEDEVMVQGGSAMGEHAAAKVEAIGAGVD